MKPTLIEFVSSFSGLGAVELMAAAKAAPRSYKMFRKPKRKGGYRTIFHPARRTKTIQYLLMRTALSRLPVHDGATGYRRGLKSPLLANATKHASNAYLLKTDFEEFFPSIKPADILNILRSSNDEMPFRMDGSDEKFLSDALFVKYPAGDVGLAIGAPSSPMVSNAVMFSLDTDFQRLAEKHNATFSRYADDVAFSTANKHACALILEEIEGILKKHESPKLTLNKKKTHLLSRKSRRPITGLIVACDATVSIGRKNKRKVRTLLFRFKYGEATDEQRKFLRGYLSFIKDVDPSFMDSILVRFGIDLINKAKIS